MTARTAAGRAFRAALLLGCLVLAAGCRTAWPSPPTEEERAAFGDVAVVVAPEVEAGAGTPVTGWVGGLGFGTLRGIGAILVFAFYGAQLGSTGGSGNDSSFAGAFGVFLGVVAGVAYFPISVVAGAATAADADEVALAETVVGPVFEDPALPGSFAERFAAEARAQSGRTFVPVPDAETVVELRIESATGGSDWNLLTVDRPFEIRVTASARVVRASDGLVIWEAVRETTSSIAKEERRTYVGWAESGGTRLRAEIHDALSRLAHGFAWSIFVQRKGEQPPRDARGVP